MSNSQQQSEKWVSAELTREDRTPFDSIDDAREVLQAGSKALDSLGFHKQPSDDAALFLAELISNAKGKLDPFNENQVSQAAQGVLLNAQGLEDVLVELEGKKIHRHDGGMITVIPEPTLC